MNRELTLLAIETGSTVCQVGLLYQGKIHLRQKAIQSHSQVLLEEINFLLERHSVQRSKIDGIAVNCGPGSFTGIRVGVSCAQGLAFGFNKPVIMLHSLEVMALDAVLRGESDRAEIFACIDARMSQIYAAWYSVSIDRPAQDQYAFISADIASLHPPKVLAPSELDRHWPLEGQLQGGIRTGSGNQFENQFPENYRCLPLLAERLSSNEEALTTDLSVAAMLKLASLKMAQGYVSSASEVLPDYIRNDVAHK